MGFFGAVGTTGCELLDTVAGANLGTSPNVRNSRNQTTEPSRQHHRHVLNHPSVLRTRQTSKAPAAYHCREKDLLIKTKVSSKSECKYTKDM